jgi:hypothetical protein
MIIPLPRRIPTRHRRQQPARETESRSWRHPRRRALVTPPTDPATPTRAEESTSEGLGLRERRKKRQRLSSRRSTGPRLTFLTID